MNQGYIVDTHVMLWILENRKVPEHIIKAVVDKDNQCYYSLVSVWEIAIKYALEKINISPEQFVGYMEAYEVFSLDIKKSHIYQVATLPHIHKDPFDRLMIAQAMVEGLTLVTADERIVQYRGVNILKF